MSSWCVYLDIGALHARKPGILVLQGKKTPNIGSTGSESCTGSHRSRPGTGNLEKLRKQIMQDGAVDEVNDIRWKFCAVRESQRTHNEGDGDEERHDPILGDEVWDLDQDLDQIRSGP